MKGPIGREEAHYRRGLVLGFTVAETILLVLFALLLALGLALSEQAKRVGRAELAARQAAAALAETKEKLVLAETRAEIAVAARNGPIPDNFVRELVRTREHEAALNAREVELREREQALAADQALRDALAEAGDGKKADRVRALAALGQQAEAALKANELRPEQQEALAGKLADAAAISEAMGKFNAFGKDGRSPADQLRAAGSELSTLRGQVTKLRQDLAAVGKGGDYPPCWITEVGRVEYLFDVALLSSGQIDVRDTTPPNRQLDREDLPVPNELFAGPVSPATFVTLTQPLYDISTQRECRFFVRIKDETAPDQKSLFKDLLLTVEGHFYKVLLR